MRLAENFKRSLYSCLESAYKTAYLVLKLQVPYPFGILGVHKGNWDSRNFRMKKDVLKAKIKIINGLQ